MDRADMDVGVIHSFLSEQSYWAKGIDRARVERSIMHSLCFGGFVGSEQVAFARVVTDQATFAYLADVFVLPEYRGKGYGDLLMQAIMAHPDLQDLRRFSLATSDAHGLYERYDFTAVARPERLMERFVADIYTKD